MSNVPRAAHASDPDESLFEERTELAWSRSSLALLAAFAIVARRVWVDDASVTSDAVAVGLLGVACLGWAVGTLGWRFVHQRSVEPRPRTPRELLAVTFGTVALALAGFVLSLTSTP
jgi:uncharacterized membrane protein YidH (DUF202 family)